ncbi:TPA: DNA primase [Escherichia coli]|nr:DNA primase [Escherichia coli]HDL8926380.1 DNA primase [Escherichia coli]HEL8063148.1 DNA primase [Escherichia coli]HEL8063840.1 DNA primase [Escherichia coli]
MKNAPSLKYQPKDKFTEVIIFAGTDAYAHAQHWIESEGRKHGDNVPPVYLGPKQLADLANIRIIDEKRRFARVYIAGEIEPIQINTIAEKLALAGVQEAKLYKGITDQEPENWRDYLQRIREQAERGEILSGRTEKKHKISLSRMADSQRAKLLAERFQDVAMNQESEVVHVWRDDFWVPVSTLDLSREMVAIYEENGTSFSRRAISNAVDALKVMARPMGEPSGDLLPFSNGVLDMKTGEFSPHSPDNWITTHNGIEYTPPVPGENIRDNAPNFHKWLDHAAGKDPRKMMRICAALYMIMANRYDWQMFIEATGEGGSGKSTITHIATLLAGKQNTVSAEMTSLDDAGGRAQVVGSHLIVLADQPKYTGEGSGIKKITGGDPVEINPKYEKRFTTIIRSVVLATNNVPMTFTERAGGVARRRVIFRFDNIVRETEKDKELPQKIAAEIPVIIRRLLANFSDPEKARELLLEQRDGAEALKIKQETDPVIGLCAALAFLDEPHGMMMGGGKRLTDLNPRTSLYRLYLAFMEYMGEEEILSVGDFGKAMKSAAREYGAEYLTRGFKGRIQTNVIQTERTEEFL